MAARAQLSPTQRPRTLIPPADPPSPMSKGKSKVDEEASPANQREIEDELGDCCGICLSDRGNGGVSRGCIDSCDHYFCFVCIMEWAKVESRCPLCKRRFSTIRRPPKPPVFPSERVVHVPVRDQVHHCFGNATIGPPDPYSESKCTVCHGVADESLLLLCDLCDCAAHTYCVGLGATIPEGDWFCQDCTLLKDEQLRVEMNTEPTSQISSDPIRKKSSSDEHVSVYDIVQEPYGYTVQRCRSISLDSRCLPHPSLTDKVTSTTANIDTTHKRSPQSITAHPLKPNARTLQHCRSLHDRIRIMRKNWNGFRSGIMHFRYGSDGGNISTKKSVTSSGGRQSGFNQQSTAQCSSSQTTDDVGAQEIEKAWKMMDKAKSIKQRIERSDISRHDSNYTKREFNTVKKADYTPYMHPSPDSHNNVMKHIGSTHDHSLGRDSYKKPSSVCGKREWRRHVTEDVYFCEVSMSSHSSKRQELESSTVVKIPSLMCSTGVRKSEKVNGKGSCEGSTCLSTSVMPDPVVLVTDVKGVNHASSSHGKLKKPMEKRESMKISVDHQKYCDAKSEIQSLVKLNLKLQTEVEKLEVNAFKEVARLATHSILAACGLEYPRPGSSSIPGFSCSHPDDARLQKVSLMPNCCRECFYIFVKEMVNTIMLQKKTIQKT